MGLSNEEIANHIEKDLKPFISIEELSFLGHTVTPILNKEGRYLGVVTFFVTTTLEGKELVISNVVGKSYDGHSFISKVEQIFFEVAKNAGCKTVRIHTKNKAIGRMASTSGFKELETIYRRVL